jgi:hypothetical protein
MNINKLAEKDAFKWARAEMFFGEGAGTRRKLLSAEIATKVERISGYHQAFETAYAKQNFADHAIKAAKERKHLDHSKMVKHNVRGLVTGNKRSLSTSVVVIGMAWYIANQTGYDEKIKVEAKFHYYKIKRIVRNKLADQKRKSES